MLALVVGVLAAVTVVVLRRSPSRAARTVAVLDRLHGVAADLRGFVAQHLGEPDRLPLQPVPDDHRRPDGRPDRRRRGVSESMPGPPDSCSG